jgi:hypothetical protein
LRGAFGDDCAGWAGKVIVLFPSTVEFARQNGAELAGADCAAEAGDSRQWYKAGRQRSRPHSRAPLTNCTTKFRGDELPATVPLRTAAGSFWELVSWTTQRSL